MAFPVDDMEEAKQFYVNVLGCTTGREKEESCVFKFFGHQIVAHLVPTMPELSTNPVDGKQVPAMHFGLVMEWNDWHQLKDKLDKNGVQFVIGPYTRYEDQPGSQATMFIVDPAEIILNSNRSKMMVLSSIRRGNHSSSIPSRNCLISSTNTSS